MAAVRTEDSYDRAFVWVWLPGAVEPVVAGRLRTEGETLVFNYGLSYLERNDAIALYLPDLPLAAGRIRPVGAMRHAHTCLSRAGPLRRTPSARLTAVDPSQHQRQHAPPAATGAGGADLDGGGGVTFRQALLATGAAPAIPDVPGLTAVSYLTSETIWDLTELPADLVVLGGGSIGCELGQAFARPGTRVTLVEGASRLLTREDPRAAAEVAGALSNDGVELLIGSGVARVDEPDGPAGVLVLDDERRVPFSRLLVAVGRSPRTRDIGLEAAGVQTDDRGFVVVDDLLRTTNPRIWAAGDLTGHPQFTHTAGVHESLAASNAVLGVRRKIDRTAVPRVTFTDPEVAAVGVATDADRSGLRTIDWSHEHVDRAVTEGATAGFTRLVIDRRSRLLGATVVGPRAGETLAERTLAITQGLTTRDLAGVTHAYPTYNDGPWNAAIFDVQSQLQRPGTRRALGLLSHARRWWLARKD